MTTTIALKRTLNQGMDIVLLKADGTVDFEGHITTCRESSDQLVASGRHLRFSALARLHDQGRLQVSHAGVAISIGRMTEEELTPEPAVTSEDFRILRLDEYSPSDLELLLDTAMLRYTQPQSGLSDAQRTRLDVWCYRLRDAWKASKTHNK